MKTVAIKAKSGNSLIHVNERLKNLTKYVSAHKAIIITDDNVYKYYKNDFPEWDIIKIGTGENIKNLDTVRHIYKRLIELEADRYTFITGIGGGIVCDITGFVASTYMRGLKFGFVSSTLLSQVDASVGGKNGVNFDAFKNMIGIFNQPEFVICDTTLLKTLPEKEILSGFAEIIKHAAIADADLFAYLELNYRKAMALQDEVIEKLVHDSVIIKSAIVKRDEQEKGERRKLNFGHTFGHAIEKTLGLPHGQAVSIGMVLAANLSVKKGLLTSEDALRLRALIQNMKLPVRFQKNAERLFDAIGKDKKREGNKIHFALLNGLGACSVEGILLDELYGIMSDY